MSENVIESRAEQVARLKREWRHRNCERVNLKKREWAAKNPESVRLTFLNWTKKNPERYALSIKKTVLKRRPKIQAYMADYSKRYYAKNRLKILSQSKEYAKANPEVVRRAVRKYRQKDLKAYRASHAAHSSARRVKLRGPEASGASALIKRWRLSKSFTCYFCGERLPTDRLHVDHFVAVSRGGKHSPENLCKSCDTCNHKKHAMPISEISFLDQRLLPI